MEQVMEFLFGNRFFELPMLEALSYIAALLMIGAAIVHLSRRMTGTASQPSGAIESIEEPYEEAPYEPYRGEWEWRKAA